MSFYVCMDTPEEAALWSAWLDRPLFVYDYVMFDLLP